MQKNNRIMADNINRLMREHSIERKLLHFFEKNPRETVGFREQMTGIEPDRADSRPLA